MSMFLDADEIRELTRRVHYSSQTKVLRSMGIEHRARPDGSLAILRAHVEQIMGLAVTKKRKASQTEPNWSALDAARTQA